MLGDFGGDPEGEMLGKVVSSTDGDIDGTDDGLVLGETVGPFDG